MSTQPIPLENPFVGLAIVALGARPGVHPIIALAAHRAFPNGGHERWSGLVRPDTARARRVPGYVLARLGEEDLELEAQEGFAARAQELAAFLGDDPVLCLEAPTAESFLRSDAMWTGVDWTPPGLLGLEQLAPTFVDLRGRKPSLEAIAQACGQPSPERARLHPADEARLVAEIGRYLVSEAASRGVPSWNALAKLARDESLSVRPLRHVETSSTLAEGPGVYVLRGQDAEPLYVGKAKRLRQRLTAYTGRPLGPTRRLDGLADTVRAVETNACASELDALLLESREIRRLSPTYNTQRHVRPPRLWLVLPDAPPVDSTAKKRKRRLAPPKLALAGSHIEAGRSLGPFRTEEAASLARDLVRALFGLDAARATDPDGAYPGLLDAAWTFLEGDTASGEQRAREALAAASDARDHEAVRRWRALLRQAVDYSVPRALLPADPAAATYALIRPANGEIEGFLFERGVFTRHALSQDPDDLVTGLLAGSQTAPRSSEDEASIVLRWLGAAAARGRLVHLPDDGSAAEQRRQVRAAARAVYDEMVQAIESAAFIS